MYQETALRPSTKPTTTIAHHHFCPKQMLGKNHKLQIMTMISCFNIIQEQQEEEKLETKHPAKEIRSVTLDYYLQYLQGQLVAVVVFVSAVLTLQMCIWIIKKSYARWEQKIFPSIMTDKSYVHFITKLFPFGCLPFYFASGVVVPMKVVFFRFSASLGLTLIVKVLVIGERII